MRLSIQRTFSTYPFAVVWTLRCLSNRRRQVDMDKTKKRRKRHTAAEKLQVIEQYHNVRKSRAGTLEPDPISLKTTSTKFNIPQRSLRRWLLKENSLRALSGGRMNILPPSNKSSCSANLLLTRRKLVGLGIIAKEDWIKVRMFQWSMYPC